MGAFKFDRTAFSMMTFKEADDANRYEKSVSYKERLKQAYYLISQAYGFSLNNPPRQDKRKFSSG